MTTYNNDKKKHGNIWYGWQRLRGVIHNRKRIGGEFSNIRTNGIASVALAAGAVISIPFLAPMMVIFLPLAATPVVLAAGAGYNAYKAARRSKDIFHHSDVNSYVSAKERGQKPYASGSYSSRPQKGSTVKKLAFGAGAVLLAGSATALVMDGKVNVQDSFNAAKDAITGTVTPKKADIPLPAPVEKPAPAPSILP